MRNDRLKLLLTFATILVLVAVTGVTLLLLQGGSRALKTRLDEVSAAMQDTSVLVGGTELLPVSGSVSVSDERGRGKDLTFEGEGKQNLTVNDLKLSVAAKIPPASATVVALRGGEEVFRGSFADFEQFVPEHRTSYVLNMTLNYTGEDYTAALDYCAEIAFDAPPVFEISSPTVAQGDTLLVYGKNIGAQDVTAEVPFSYVPVVVYRGTDCMILLPFNYIRDPGDYNATIHYLGETYILPFTVTEADFPVQHLEVSESVSSSTYDNSAAVAEYNNTIPPLLETFDPQVRWRGTFQYPFEGDIKPHITTEYGIRRYVNDSTTPTRHTGIDIAKATGTPVMATAAGNILFSGYLQMSGNTVIVDHGCGVMSLNLHMDSLRVETGDAVEQGDVIGTVGETGFATGPHLHYALFVGGHAVNPWLAFDGTAGFYQIGS